MAIEGDPKVQKKVVLLPIGGQSGGQIILEQFFISQSAPDIKRKLQRFHKDLQAEGSQLVVVSYLIFINCDAVEDKWEQTKEQIQPKVMSLLIYKAPDVVCSTKENQGHSE